MKNLIPTLILPLIIYFFSFSLLMYNMDFYNYLFEKNNINVESKEGITKELFAYFQSNDFSKPNFDYFTERENSHLLDVKIVLRKSLLLLETLLLILILWVIFISDKPSKVFLYGALLTILITVFLAIIPFDFLFDNFHFSVFPQGSWKFPPDYLLVNIYTESFFQGFLYYICIVSAIISIIILLISSISFTTIKFK